MRKNQVYIFLTILLPVLYGIFVIKNFSTPLSSFNGGDVEEWEYVGYFLSENISFNPLPSLSLEHNQTFYPYGTKQVFLDWSLESNYWYAFFYKTFGYGAWLNIYLILSLIISFLGSFLILKKDFGQTKAFCAGFMVTFLNFYALLKYPVHFPHSTLHWTILSIFTDFILFRRFYFYQNFSLKWVMLKAFLLVAVLGLNIGYVAGFALSSFTITFFVFWIILLIRFESRGKQFKQLYSYWKTEFKASQLQLMLFSLPILLYLYLFLPLILQIYIEAKSFDIDTSHLNSFWSHPLRLFLPYFGFLNAIPNPLQHIFHDMPEGESAGSVGWVCLALGIFGFFKEIKKNWIVFLPLIILFLLAIVYHPNKIPTLKIFPWFEFNRVGSRFTSIIPVIFACFFLSININLNSRVDKIVFAFIGLFLVSESATLIPYFLSKKVYFVEKDLLSYMKRVESQQGEAVLDFPFCIVGGDGAGLKENLCSVYEKTCGNYAFKRFHHKKVIGGYYSHVPKGELALFEKLGVGNLFYGNGDWISARKVKNTFNDAQLQYFLAFFKKNDFCGINIYRDLISEDLYQKIILNIGKPVIRSKVSGSGTIEFIPKPQNWYKEVDGEKGKKVTFPCGC